MILKKVIEDNKEIYVPISLEEAAQLKDRSLLVFTSEDSEDEFEDYLDELEEREEEERERLEEEREKMEDKWEEKMDKLEEKLDKLKDFDVFNFDFSHIGKGSKIMSILPFLSREQLSEIVNGYIDGTLEYDINITCLFPFICREDCDKLFNKFLSDESLHSYVYKIIPFVSSNVLQEFVNEYVNGKYQNIDVKKIYPFLPNYSIKQLFDYLCKK